MRVYESYDAFCEDSAIGAVYLYDCGDHRLLYAKNEEVPRPVASLTKIATAMHVLECASNPENNMIEMTRRSVEEALRLEGNLSVLSEHVGMRFSVMEYLYGLMISSGCEVGIELSDFVSGGNRAAFINAMNALAAREGCRDTRFCDPCGLLDDGQSTARDIFLLFRRMLEIPILRRIAATVILSIPHIPEPIEQTNYLMRFSSPRFFPYAVCSKTGFTDLAGRCLACLFERRGKTYIAVVLGGDPNTNRFYDDMASLICTAFAREGRFIRVTLDRHDAKASVGSRFALRPRAIFNNTGEEPRFRFESLNPQIASADEYGLVAVRREGVALIKILVQTGDYDLLRVNSTGNDAITVCREFNICQ